MHLSSPPQLSSKSLQVLSFFAPFRSYITLVDEWAEAYFLHIQDTDLFPKLSLLDLWLAVDELEDSGWWQVAEEEWAFVKVHPLAEYFALQLYKELSEVQKSALDECFIEYYKSYILPKSVLPYLKASTASAVKIGVFVSNFELRNLEALIEKAAQHNCLSSEIIEALDLYWLQQEQHQTRIYYNQQFIDKYANQLRRKGLLSLVLFHLAQAQRAIEDFQSALNSVNQALQQPNLMEIQLGILYQQKGTILNGLEQPDAALILFEQAKAIFEKHEDKERMAEISQNLGAIKFDQRAYKAAIEETNLALEAYEKGKRQYFQGFAHLNLAANYLKLNQLEEALQHSQIALDLFSSFGDNKQVATMYRQIGIIYSQSKNFILAKAYFQKAINLYLVMDTTMELGTSWYDLGSIALQEGKLDIALDYYFRSAREQIGTKAQSTSFHMIAYIIDIYKKQTQESIQYYQKAVNLADQSEQDAKWFQIHYNYGNCLLRLNYFLEAIQIYEKAASFYEARSPDNELANLYYNLCLAYYKADERSKGNQNYKKAKQLYFLLKDEKSIQELEAEIAKFIE